MCDIDALATRRHFLRSSIFHFASRSAVSPVLGVATQVANEDLNKSWHLESFVPLHILMSLFDAFL